MTTQITIDLARLDTMIAAMNEVGDQATQLDTYVANSVCSTAGFDYPRCALKPIGDALHHVSEVFDQATDTFQRSWAGLGDAAVATARHQQDQDAAVADALGSYRGSFKGADKCWVPSAGHADFHISALDLRAAKDGEETLDHDPLFETAATTWDEARDKINGVLDKARSLGVDLGKLPEKSLRDFIVYPLSGNYRKIRANADACGVLDDAMEGWGRNFGQLGAKSYDVIEGRTGDGLRAHLALYGVTMTRVGDGIGKAHVVFDAIAATSERIAVKVEKVIAMLSKKLASLAARIGKRVNPVLNLMITAGDAVTKGPVQAAQELLDIINDVKDVYDTIHDCFSLVDTIRAWAQTQADRLKEFHEILDTVSSLPGVGDAPGLGSITRHVGDVSKKLSDIDYKGRGTGTEAADLARDVAGLGASDTPPPAPSTISQRNPEAPLRDPATGGLVA